MPQKSSLVPLRRSSPQLSPGTPHLKCQFTTKAQRDVAFSLPLSIKSCPTLTSNKSKQFVPLQPTRQTGLVLVKQENCKKKNQTLILKKSTHL